MAKLGIEDPAYTIPSPPIEPNVSAGKGDNLSSESTRLTSLPRRRSNDLEETENEIITDHKTLNNIIKYLDRQILVCKCIINFIRSNKIFKDYAPSVFTSKASSTTRSC